VVVARHEKHLLARGEREQIVVSWIARMQRRRILRVRRHLRDLSDQVDEAIGIREIDSSLQLRSRKCTPQLVEQCRADDELELPFEPESYEPRGRSCSRKESRDQDVRVEQDPHALRAARLVLRVDSDSHRLVLSEAGGVPDSLEEVDAKVAAKRFLDHLAVATPGSGSLDSDGSQHSLVKGNGRAGFPHNCIIAS
jgi:hypothetical protein